MAAMHFDNPIFILLVVVALLFRWLASKAGQASKDADENTDANERSTSTPARSPQPPNESESDTERIRKFLEALGQPPGSQPPRPVTPRADIPPRPIAPIKPPAEMVAKFPLPRPKSQPPKIQLPEETPAPSPEKRIFKPHSTEPALAPP